jgi:hypothetical protein
MRELYVYYRVREAEAAAAQRDIESLQAELRAIHVGLDARLLRRPEANDGLLTWMEIYARPTDPRGVDEMLQAEIEARAVNHGKHLEWPRHVEVFVGLPKA